MSTAPCPYCGGTIQNTAIVCKFCDQNVTVRPRKKPHPPTSVPATPSKQPNFAIQPGAVTSHFKLCPYCAEEIQAAAIRCKHCASDLQAKASEYDPIIGAPTNQTTSATPSRNSIYGMRPIFKVLLGLILVLVVLAGAVSYFAPDTKTAESPIFRPQNMSVESETDLSADARAVKSIRDQMAEIETAVAAGEDGIADLSKGYREKSKADRAVDLAKVNEGFHSLVTILDRSAAIEIPTISQPNIARPVAEMIDEHKQWALIQQARIGALMQENVKAFETLTAQADRIAGQEAVHLMMAYKAAGLEAE